VKSTLHQQHVGVFLYHSVEGEHAAFIL